MSEWLTMAATILSMLGGVELIKWLYTRKSKGEVAKAEAEAAHIKAQADEYHLLRERIEFLNEQLNDKEKRFQEQNTYIRDLNQQILDRDSVHADQTLHVRTLNAQILVKEMQIGDLKAQVSELLAERKMKLCERKGCANRQPQSGY